ncbi:MAG: hypothetical protein U0587_11120 [Candidatus Binatia bacterium]
MGLEAPLLSTFDPPEAGEGSVDPLSLQPTYERLAERIYPFMTVRMARIRLLTAVAVITRVCEGLEDEVAADGITPAWLVAEWYIVEGLVRRRETLSKSGWRRIPGSQKVERALRDSRRLGAVAYLKTPTVFGFTGIYKRVAVGLQMVTDNIGIDSGAVELLGIWERSQQLPGFGNGSTGPGAAFREDFRRAVKAGLRTGYTDRPAGWSGFDLIAQHLDPGRVGKKEADWLHARLIDPGMPAPPRDPYAARMRGEMLALLEQEGGAIVSRTEESRFIRRLLRNGGVSSELKERLRAIDAYERLVAPLEKSLRLIFFLSSERRCDAITVDEFAGDRRAEKLATMVAPAVRVLSEIFSGSDWEPEVTPLIARYENVSDARALFGTLLDHHEEAQRNKPPDGKRSWVDRPDDRRVAVRSAYATDSPPEPNDEYLRDYRTSTASHFLQDLRRLP